MESDLRRWIQVVESSPMGERPEDEDDDAEPIGQAFPIEQVRMIYTDRYRQIKEVDTDPFGPMPIII
jgi:hypothetical protein